MICGQLEKREEAGLLQTAKSRIPTFAPPGKSDEQPKKKQVFCEMTVPDLMSRNSIFVFLLVFLGAKKRMPGQANAG